MSGMRRRTMLGAIVASLVPVPLLGRPLPLRRLGVLWIGRADDPANKRLMAALVEGLAARGWDLNGVNLRDRVALDRGPQEADGPRSGGIGRARPRTSCSRSRHRRS